MIYGHLLRLFSGMKYVLENEIYYGYKIERLKARGMKVGKDVYVGLNVEFDHNYPYLIEIGDHCRITSRTLILAHDATTFRELNATRLAKVKILEGTFIGYGCVILPGCTIGPHAMIAAGSVVNRDIGEGQMAAGNPARPYGKYTDLLEKYRAELPGSFLVDKKEYLRGRIAPQEIVEELDKNRLAFMMGHPRTQSTVDRLKLWRKDYGWIG